MRSCEAVGGSKNKRPDTCRGKTPTASSSVSRTLWAFSPFTPASPAHAEQWLRISLHPAVGFAFGRTIAGTAIAWLITMKKPYVICHMMPSVDGRLRTDRWDIPAAAHDEYERTANTYRADAWLCGRKTMEEFATGRSRPRRRHTRRMRREDFIVPQRKGAHFAIAVDSHGKLPWASADIDGDPLIAVLTEDVSDDYMTFLQDRGVSYIFAGKKAGTVDLPLALMKLRQRFGIKRLLLEGGGETNGAFLRAGLVDELSMLLTPVADGRQGEPALFDVEHVQPAKAVGRLSLQSARKAAADMVWVRYRVRRAGKRQAA